MLQSPPSEAFNAVLQRVSTLEKDVKELKQVDHSVVIVESIRSQVPTAVNEYLGSSLGDSLQKVLQRHTEELKQEFMQQESQKSASEIIKIKQEQASKQKWPEHSTTPFDKIAENEYEQKDILFQMMIAPTAATVDYTHVKRKYDDQDEDPTARSDKVKEKKRPRKDTQSSKKSSTSKESSKDTTPSKTSKSGKSVSAEEPNEEHVHEVTMDAKENIADEMGNAEEQPDSEAAPKTDNAPRNNWFKQPLRPPTPNPEGNKCQVVDDQPEQTWFNDLISAEKDPLTFDKLIANPINFYKFAMNRLKIDKLTKAHLVGPIYELLKGNRCLFDLSKPLPLKGRPGHLTVAAEYFFNNDLEYLKSSDSERKYTTSITKTKAVQYDLVGIEDMILKLWSVTKVDSECGKIEGQKQHNYGYLEEIMVRRADRQLYTFKECDFVNLHLNDIDDMLLIVVQHKLFHLDSDVIVDLAVALRMFTRSLVIKNRVEDVQLGVESYQKKLNITKPQKDFPIIIAKELYTPSFDPPGVVYEYLSNRKRLMRADELYKFSDGTLKLVRDTLHHRLQNFRLGYNKDMPRRKWSATDKKWSGIMVDLIDKLMLEKEDHKEFGNIGWCKES
ncbi:hypothetical protein Tco_0873062 [Tanacetum coccineum]